MKKISNIAIIISLIVLLLIIWRFTNWSPWLKPIVTKFITESSSYLDLIHQFVDRLWHRIVTDRYEWFKLITTTSVGGLLSYFYVMYRENKKDERVKSEECTTALLNTQMTIILQIEELKSLEEFCLSITNFNLSSSTLVTHLQGIEGVSAKAAKLRELVHQQDHVFMELLKFTYHLIITPPTNTITVLPQKIFDLPTKKQLPVAELARYFRDLSSCNRKYMQIVALITHHNEIRNIVINQPISKGESGIQTPIAQQEEYQKILSIIAAKFELAVTLNKQIIGYLAMADTAFTKAGNYIELLGIVPSLQVARDNNGKMVFDKFDK